jgi:uncharacterized protein YgbK (DUF1537 family)
MPFRPDTLRLMADDMTGALDSAAGLVGVFGPLAVGIRPGPDCPVLDTATRETTLAEAEKRVAALANHLAPAPGHLSYFKVDSLLRGHAGGELAAVLRANHYRHVIIAPALPFQNRVTRQGRQGLRDAAGGWEPTGEDLAQTLRLAGFTLSIGSGMPPGLSFHDAESDADLDRLVANGLAAEGPVLWVGSGGLAAALGRAFVGGHPPCPALPGPLLGMIGTDHPVMLGQLDSLPNRSVKFIDQSVSELPALAERDALFLRPALPAGLCRAGAQAEIASLFGGLVRHLPRPGALFVSGGETLRALLLPLGVERVRVLGEWEPGLPVSELVGGRWSGLMVVSKSGAFGTPDLLNRLLASLTTPSVDISA